MKVKRIDGEFVVYDAISGQPLPDQEQYNWLYEAESLAGLNVSPGTSRRGNRGRDPHQPDVEANLLLSTPSSTPPPPHFRQVEEVTTPKAAPEEPKKMSLKAQRTTPEPPLTKVRPSGRQRAGAHPSTHDHLPIAPLPRYVVIDPNLSAEPYPSPCPQASGKGVDVDKGIV